MPRTSRLDHIQRRRAIYRADHAAMLERNPFMRPPRRFDHTALAIAITGACGWLIPLAWLFYYLTR